MATALRWIAAMAYGSRFCDLFDRVELLLLHSEAKSWLRLKLLVSYSYASWIKFWSSKPRTRQIYSASCAS